ncbi:tripartite ATP-independent transporter DctM subunit [Spinactinospora alkalitolerans]|uniref:Tripartite ATP-independent transporter DctM subunit n=1 Tax=Spinactinospora alkalitolerans TaxID=687207 RepID=A0A852U5G3_9ACTN|nr:TRAP transporter large permease [Spinactinospora alkalitolerans]NYE50123.1 tripartite ATP-independent transporter DctM subunit [Spinactinospora alkalitolerans]
MSAGLVILGILVLLALRVPIAFAILGPCVTYMAVTDQSTGLSLRTAAQEVNSFPLLAVPLFVLVGVTANHTGIAERIFAFAQVLFGRVRGSLGYVNIGVSVGFSWMSGAALADVAGLGKMEVPAMVRRGYPRRFALGLSAASSLISPIMPPSIPAIVYASVAAVSTAALFAAAVVPAFLVAGGLVLAVFLWSRDKPHLAGRRATRGEVSAATVRVIGPLGAPVILLGGILGGLFTPTEAAAVGAAYVMVLGFCYRELSLRTLWRIAVETATAAASIAIILAASGLLGWILARERVPQDVASFLLGLTDSPVVFLLLVNLVLILIGMVLEPVAALVITVPVLLPIAVQFGVDPVHFGVIAILNLMLGLLTPPIGGVLFVLGSATRSPMHEVFRGTAPFLIPLVLVLVLLTVAPDLVLFLPDHLGL